MELKPYAEEEAKPLKVTAVPGTVLMIRSDKLRVRHLCRTRTLLLSCNLQASGGTNARLAPNPCAAKLQVWLDERLHNLKQAETEDRRAELPRHLRLAMNRQCFKGQYMAVRGLASRVAPCWGPETFWCGAASGMDAMQEVPLMRWDHEKFYDPDDNSWRLYRTFSRHMSFVDGVDLFDNKMFSITPAESKIMDPQQRVVLEVGYEALFSGGYKKGKIMNSLGGMYLGYGTGNSDFGHVERTTDGSAEGSFGATGGSAAITANRFSFVLGMKGPSIAVDAEDASALLSVHMGCEALHTKGRALANEFSLCGGIKLNLAAFYWPQQQAAGWLSKVGRCQAFDGAADGWVHGDSSVNLLIKTLTENVDGKLVAKENEPYLASICGSSVRHAGYSASLAAPHGPTEQEVLSTAVYAAGLTGMDIDGCEMYGIGSQLADPVEANSCSRVLRLADDDDAPLLMKASKTGIGNAQHGGSGVSIMQSILTSIAGSIGPNMHLRQTNPYLDISELPLHFVTEVVPFRMASTFMTSFSRGFGGTNVSVVSYAAKDTSHLPDSAAPMPLADGLVFWPGGGGKVDGDSMPKEHFAIAGTFSEWEPQPMKKESEGVFSCSVTLGENRWEQFQIWLDGDPLRCLYPEQHKAPSKSSVCGPDADSGGNSWLLDGRPQAELRLRPKGPPGGASGAAEEATGRGLAGSAWKVRLAINGKWRLVEWERLEQPLVPVEDLKKGAYFITADFNGWGIEPMVQQADGSWTFEVHLIRPGGQFQILRNRDSEQVLYPAAWADRDPSAVRGPDDGSDGRCWYLKGEQCDVFCVSLQRRIDDGLDVKKVSIERTGQKELNDAQLRQLGRLRLAAFGTWDRGSRLRELPWAGTCFHFFVQLGSEGRESFQLLEDFNWNRVIHPSVPNARAAVEYKVEGPEVGDAKTRGLNWTIGLDGYEKPGDVFEVLVYGETHRVERVRWQRVDPMIGAAAIRKAEETGLLFGK
ncbi:ppsD [Symbiodinium microadriaticum]|nr:ppsD [Symbiodinium microadriaticum]